MKGDFAVHHVPTSEAKLLLARHHYLDSESQGVRFGYNYGLFKGGNQLLFGTFSGLAIFHGPSAPETMVGCFGVERDNQDGFFELGRFVMNPATYEKNLSSWFLSRAIKRLRQETNVRAILTYADERYHKGYLYQATNFDYYGMTDPKCDFWIKQDDGTFVKHNRGPTKHLEGEWRPRPRKHRYLMVFDDSLNPSWEEQEYPKGHNRKTFNREATKRKERTHANTDDA